MKEQLISLETAKKAESKGCTILEDRYNMSPDGIVFFKICTQSLLAKWLRDVHNIHISIDFDLYDGVYDYGVYFIDSTNCPCHFDLEHRITFEDAMEAALLYSLDLIS